MCMVQSQINPTGSVIPIRNVYPEGNFIGIKQKAGLAEPKHHKHCFLKKKWDKPVHEDLSSLFFLESSNSSFYVNTAPLPLLPI